LANVLAGTHPAQILAAKAALVQVTSEREAARVRLDDARALLGDPQEIQAQIVQAQAEVDLAAAQIEQAQAQVAGAEAQRDRYRGQGSMEEKALFRMFDYQVAAARAAQEAAEAHTRGAEDTIRMLQTLRDHPLGLASQVHLAEGASVADRAVAVAGCSPS
jgi:chromosome segregation ATPase